MIPTRKNTDADSEFDCFRLSKHKRLAVRYIRDDIRVSIRFDGFLSRFAFWLKALPVRLIDISSRGVLIGCPKKLKIPKRIIVTLVFKDSKTFILPGRIIRAADDNHYGVRFSGFSHPLGEHLLKTQEDRVRLKEVKL